MNKDQCCNNDCNQGRNCSVREGAHKPAEAVHQIQEPAPVTAMDALREAEAALEVAMARILKADPGHSICVTSEAKALVAVRAALAATPAADAPLPLLVRDIARELGITCAEACLALKPLGNFSTNTAVTAEMMAKLRERFPERAPASEVAGARERMTAGRACYFMERFLKEEKLLGPNEQAALHYVIDMLEAAAAPVVLPEPAMNEEGYLPCPFCGSDQVSLSTGEMSGGQPWHYVECESCTATAEPEKWNERALLATGGQAQAVEQEPFGYFKAEPFGWTDCGPDDEGAVALYERPQAQADARDAEITWPKARDVGRIGDMSQVAHIRVGFDSDNNVFVSVWDENGGGSIEFCNPGGGGGGQSSRTRMALIALMVAMEADNADKPSRDWWAQSAAQAAQGGE